MCLLPNWLGYVDIFFTGLIISGHLNMIIAYQDNISQYENSLILRPFILNEDVDC